jgi:hypothetical protein
MEKRTASHVRKMRKLVNKNREYIIRSYDVKLYMDKQIYMRSLAIACVGACNIDDEKCPFLRSQTCNHCKFETKISSIERAECMMEMSIKASIENLYNLKKQSNGLVLESRKSTMELMLEMMKHKNISQYFNDRIQSLLDWIERKKQTKNDEQKSNITIINDQKGDCPL